jgi:MFS family permease
MTAARPFQGPRVVAVAFLTLMGAFGLNLTGGQFFAPLTAAHGWDLSTLSLAVSVNMVTWGVFQPVMGRLIDRLGPKPVIAASCAIMGLSFLLSATIDSIWEFFLYYGVLTAIGFAGCGSMANSVLVARWYVRGRAPMLARSAMGMNIGQLVFLPLAGWLIVASGYEGAFAILGLIMLAGVTPAVLLFVRNDPREIGQGPDGDPLASFKRPASRPFSEAVRSRDYWCASLGFVTCGYSLYMVTMHLPRFAVDLGGSLALGGVLLGIAAGASAVSMWLMGQLAPRYGKKPLLVGLYVLRAAALAWLATSSSVWQLYVFAVVYGLASMPVIPLKTGLIGDLYGANALGTILGSVWLYHQVFAAVGVYLGGFVRSTTGAYDTAFLSASLLLLAGGAFTAMVREPRLAQAAA